MSIEFKPFLRALLFVVSVPFLHAQQPVDAPLIPLSELKPGMKGEVWTVFRGTEPEPFAVEVTGVIQNAIGPGKAMIICELSDPRVQSMGAVAGMSGSPLYIGGRLAGALSYQVQRFETVHYAGFTPAADLAEVQSRVNAPGPGGVTTSAATAMLTPAYQALQPVFTFSGLSPAVAELFAGRFAALGLGTSALGGSSAGAAPSGQESPLTAGSAVSVALSTGDITLAGTGTVSRIEGKRITAFGHPMLALGDVELPMCEAEIVTILPSNMQSIKVANTGAVIGTIAQDRLSGIAGTLGPGPAMIPVEVLVKPQFGAPRSLHFSVVRQAQLTPAVVAAGVTQAILSSNDAGLTEGFRLRSEVAFPAGESVASQTLYAGPQAFSVGLGDFVQRLTANLQNPYEKTFPDRVKFTVEALAQNPTAVLDLFQLSRTTARAGETVQATIAWRDWQGESHRDVIGIPVDADWTGKNLQVILAPGRAVDELTGHPRVIPAAQLRSFDAYVAALNDDRRSDGLYLEVVEKAPVFTDQTTPTLELPGTFERIARGADEARYQKRDTYVPLWEQHVLPGRLLPSQATRTLQVAD
ncbi:MAG TPA: hypothetical protein VG838_15395 [Opitutaceae bacterium]|nr:hypothetical protein [Opitutaceae bacterium]